MPKYGNFENRPVSRKALPIDQNLAQFRPTGVEREYYVQLPELLPMAKFHAQIYAWNFGQWPSWFSSRTTRSMGLLLYDCVPISVKLYGDIGSRVRIQAVGVLK